MTNQLPKSDSDQAFIVAELSSNHAGKLENALKLIELAKEAGCDAVKLQSYTPDSMTFDTNRDEYIIKGGAWSGMKLYDLYDKAKTPYAWHKRLFEFCRQLEIICFSSPFDEKAVDLLEGLDCPIYKIASFEINDLALIKYIAKTKKPIIISCGMASLDEIAYAYFTAIKNGSSRVYLLHCISSYPAKVTEMNLKQILLLKYLFADNSNTIIGLSDHTLSNIPANAAFAIGARVFEKHIKLDNTKSLDDSFSLTKDQFKSYIDTIRSSEKMMGYDVTYSSVNFGVDIACKLAKSEEQHKIKSGEQHKSKSVEQHKSKSVEQHKSKSVEQHKSKSLLDKKIEDYNQEILNYYNILDKFNNYLTKWNKYAASQNASQSNDDFFKKGEQIVNKSKTNNDTKQIADQDKNRFFKRSIFAKETIQKGERLTEINTIRLRPNLGLDPIYYPLILGTTAKVLIKKGMPINLDLISSIK